MGLNEDIQKLNTRITNLERKREEAKRTLAVEEHKLKTIEAQLSEEGIEVAGMEDSEIDDLLNTLSEKITKELDRVTEVLNESEELFNTFQGLK